MNKLPLVYLACPYAHPDAAVRAERFRQANVAAGRLMLGGNAVFSPISHSHVIQNEVEMPDTWEFWKAQDFAVLEKCSKLYVLTLDGWEKSVGVQAEIEMAYAMGIDIEFYNSVPGAPAGMSQLDKGWVKTNPIGPVPNI